jgi:hypothetical protein
VQFKITKYWLKSSNSTKVIIKAIQEGRIYKLVGVFNPWLQMLTSRLRGVTCAIRDLDMYLCKL